MSELELDKSQYMELENLGLGVFAPLTGFMDEDQFHSVVQNMRLPDGEPFPLPVVLDLSDENARRLRGASQVNLIYQDQEVGKLRPTSLYRTDKEDVAKIVYGCADPAHPGVAKFLSMGDTFIGGPVELTCRVRSDGDFRGLTPEQCKALFKQRDYKSIVGFQTRNVPHRAHEYLQRVALEHCDGLFIQPLIGHRKVGDFTPEAILAGYRTLIEKFYPEDRVVLDTLSTVMRFAGPREAVFHAIIRRNYGCTHFIVGRDHAGVGGYYGIYDAHRMTEKFDGMLGIQVLRFHGPYHCSKCNSIVTDKTCPHAEKSPESIRYINGQDIRDSLANDRLPSPDLMRPEVVESLKGIPLLVTESDQ